MQKMTIFKKQKNQYMPLMIGLGVVVVILFVILIIVLTDNGEQNDYQPRKDPISGETIWEINEEPEAGGELVLVGFNQISQFGFMSAQYIKITDAVKEYTKNNYPGAKLASYKKDSFKYLDKNLYASSFEYVLNTGETLLVTLDTGGSLSSIDVKISKN